MCLSTPGRVMQVQDAMAEVEVTGHTAWYNALSRPDVKIGDYVLTYANMIVDIISAEEAQRIQQTLDEMAEALGEETRGAPDELDATPDGAPTSDDSSQT
jgi:hydrogenase assembly chaperone HypC/HupF